jgi:DNA-binding NarL/FixJ family response regulator
MHLYVIDRHPIAREGLKHIVNTAGDLTVVGESDSCDGVADVLPNDCDLLILDGELDTFQFLNIFNQNHNRRHPPFVLIVSRQPEDQRAVAWIKAGANGYVTKTRSLSVILDAIRRVGAGGRYISTELSEAMLADLNTVNRTRRLSRREHEVLSLLASGSGASQIAAQLSLSAKTVSTYRARVLDKLNLKTTAALVRYAVKEGLVE